ncbi:MAG: formate/nitrite transporter family protein [Coriobacteriales bacterium]|nr:formate/nitrite transporter family protein [Coriobacteriales bacterium]
MPTNDYPTVDALVPAKVFAKAVSVGEGKASIPPLRAFVLACLAGFFIGMGGMFMLLVKSDAALSFTPSALLGGFAFSLGLFAVLVAGAELFTGNNLMLLGCLEGRYSATALLRSWCLVYLGNLVGSLLLAVILVLANFGGMNGGAVSEVAVSVAVAKCSLPPLSAFFRGIMCNVLVCLAVWMGFAGKTVVDKFLAAAMPVMGFVACGFEHCIANMFFLPYGLMLSGGSAVTMGAICVNILVVTLGNMVGGALLLGGAYWLAFGRNDA